MLTQVIATRAARAEATRRFLLPAGSGPVLKSRDDNQQGLFEAFEYMPSRYSLADELESKERVEVEAKRMAVRCVAKKGAWRCALIIKRCEKGEAKWTALR